MLIHDGPKVQDALQNISMDGTKIFLIIKSLCQITILVTNDTIDNNMP